MSRLYGYGRNKDRIMEDRILTRASKYIALLLRHHPEEGGITLDKHGWCKTGDLVKAVRARYPGFSAADLETIVETDEKHRYCFDQHHQRIRAQYGHSVPVDVELRKAIPPGVLYHGTAVKTLPIILRDGLMPMSRLYVHLSTDVETAKAVAVRHGKPVVLRVDTKRMAEDGIDFWIAENGVWLVKSVPAKYLSVQGYS